MKNVVFTVVPGGTKMAKLCVRHGLSIPNATLVFGLAKDIKKSYARKAKHGQFTNNQKLSDLCYSMYHDYFYSTTQIANLFGVNLIVIQHLAKVKNWKIRGKKKPKKPY